MGIHARVLADGANAQLRGRAVVEVFHDGTLPVAVVADATEVREWFLWGASLALHPRQEVAEIDQEATEPHPLILRHGHYTGDIVFLLTRFLLREIAHKMAAFAVILGQDVEKKRLHIVVKCLVIKE